MVVSIEIETANSMARIAGVISAEVSVAADCLAPIAAHDEWSCIEKDLINDSVLNLKNNSIRLQEVVDAFSSKLTGFANEFEELEKAETSAVEKLHDATSEAICIKTPLLEGVRVSIPETKDFLKRSLKSSNDFSGMDNYQVHTMIEPIKIVNLASINMEK